MTKILRVLVPLLGAVLLSGCLFSSPRRAEVEAAAPTETPPATRAGAVEPVLYARDGTVVSRPRAGGPAEGPARDLQGNEGSRMYLLELYQQAIDEKESLQREVEALNAALAAAREEIESLTAERTALQSANAALEADRDAEHAQTIELAARLATAQIGRLEAERLLLETKIQWQTVQGIVGTDEEPKRASKTEEFR